MTVRCGCSRCAGFRSELVLRSGARAVAPGHCSGHASQGSRAGAGARCWGGARVRPRANNRHSWRAVRDGPALFLRGDCVRPERVDDGGRQSRRASPRCGSRGARRMGDAIVRVAGMEALFHEKPFARLNGSGKHNNWCVMRVPLCTWVSSTIPRASCVAQVCRLEPLRHVLRARRLTADEHVVHAVHGRDPAGRGRARRCGARVHRVLCQRQSVRRCACSYGGRG